MTMTATTSAPAMYWYAYVERRAVRDGGTQADRRDERLTREPVAILATPDGAVDWLTSQIGSHLREADQDGQMWNSLSGVGERGAMLQRRTAQGKSAYASVRIDSGNVVDLCVEAVPADECVYTQSGPRAGDDCPKAPEGTTSRETKRVNGAASTADN